MTWEDSLEEGNGNMMNTVMNISQPSLPDDVTTMNDDIKHVSKIMKVGHNFPTKCGIGSFVSESKAESEEHPLAVL